jgi:hypothetical protein
MKHLTWTFLLLATGCASGGSAHYGASDNRQTISADQDTTFYVSLPDTMKAKAAFSQGVLALRKDSVDDVTHQRTLEFTAVGLGETEIKVGADFSLRVRVTSASDRPGMHVHTR